MHLDYELSVRTDARAALATLTARLATLPGCAAISRQVSDFVACFEDLPQYGGYKHVPAAAHSLHQQIGPRIGATAVRQFLFAAILQALLNTLDGDRFARLPDRVRGHQLKQFRRIVDNEASVTDACELDNDLFHKDFGLALLRLYAAAAQLVDFRAGIGRVSLVKKGLRELPARLALFAKMGGFKPFFEIHTHLAYLDEFNEEGWNECYRCCAELYAIHPQVLGMYGGSWFYDPALATFSPRLSYLRDVPTKGGAHLLFDSVSDQAIHDATATSPTRKALYESGKYVPTAYALIWPRAAQLRWHATESALPQRA